LPSVSYSITVRLEVPAGGSTVSKLTTAVEQAGGLVSALDVTASGHERLRIDVTCAAADTAHAGRLVEAMRAASLRTTPMAMLSRGVSGIAGTTLIVNFPGSPRGVDESFGVIAPALRHAVDLLHGDGRRHH